MLVALALLAAGALVVRGAGQVLPEQLAMFPALALSIGLPGAAVLRIAGLDERLLPATALGAAPVLGLAAWIPLLLVALVVGLPLAAALWTLLAASAVALALAGPPRIPLGREALGVALAGLGTAVLAARWAKPVLESDALFHAGRVRKLVDLHELSFGGLSAYQDGHVHAGYAFPIVHAAEAGAVELAGVDPSVGFLALVPACAFLVPAAVYAAGRILGGMPAAIAVVGFVVWDAISSSGGVLDSSEQPGGLVFRVVVPVCIALIVEVVRLDDEPRTEGALVAAVLVAVLAHPTYVMPVLAMITAAVIARRGRGWRAMAGAFAVSAATLGRSGCAAIRGTGGAAGTRLDPGGFALLGGHPVIRDGDIVIEGRLAVLLGLLAIPLLVAAWRGTHTLAGAIGAGALAVLCLPGLPALLAPLIGPHQVGRLRGALPWPELLALLLVLLAATWPGRVWWIAAGLAAASLGVAWLGDGGAIAQTALVAGIAVAGVVLVSSGWPPAGRRRLRCLPWCRCCRWWRWPSRCWSGRLDRRPSDAVHVPAWHAGGCPAPAVERADRLHAPSRRAAVPGRPGTARQRARQRLHRPRLQPGRPGLGRRRLAAGRPHAGRAGQRPRAAPVGHRRLLRPVDAPRPAARDPRPLRRPLRGRRRAADHARRRGRGERAGADPGVRRPHRPRPVRRLPGQPMIAR